MFRLLQATGAKMASRTLHKAVQAVANAGADLSILNSVTILVRHKNRISILKYFVEDCKMDINKLGDQDGDPFGRFGYWGTLLCYAASECRGAKVISWLIDKGADTRIGKGGGYSMLGGLRSYRATLRC